MRNGQFILYFELMNTSFISGNRTKCLNLYNSISSLYTQLIKYKGIDGKKSFIGFSGSPSLFSSVYIFLYSCH